MGPCIASRSIYASQLKAHPLWWNGPTWLKNTLEFWPNKEENAKIVLATVTTLDDSTIIVNLINKYSNYSKLQRVVAYIFKFINKLRKKPESSEYLSVDELEKAEKYIISHQETEFYNDLADLKSLANLFPFLDKDGLLRVGGRLQNSNLLYNQQHPIILNKSHLASIIVKRSIF